MSVTNRHLTTMPRDLLSEPQCNVEFVKCVQKYPCLYNFELPSYSYKDVCDQAWEEVAEAMDMTPSACKEKWRNIRTVFMRTVKATGNGKKKRPYYLAKAMQFVVPFLRPTTMTEAEKQKVMSIELARAENARSIEDRQTPSVEIEVGDIKTENVENEDTAHSGQEWCAEDTTARKRPLEIEDQYSVQIKKRPSSVAPLEISDSVTSFVDSLMPELREMNFAQFKCFKRRVLVLIDEITSEIPNISQVENDYIV